MGSAPRIHRHQQHVCVRRQWQHNNKELATAIQYASCSSFWTGFSCHYCAGPACGHQGVGGAPCFCRRRQDVHLRQRQQPAAERHAGGSHRHRAGGAHLAARRLWKRHPQARLCVSIRSRAFAARACASVAAVMCTVTLETCETLRHTLEHLHLRLVQSCSGVVSLVQYRVQMLLPRAASAAFAQH